MTKEHKIRVALRGLTGREREETVLALMQDPSKVDKAVRMRMKYPDRRGARKPRPVAKTRDVNISFRLTYKQYAELRHRAKAAKVAMSKFFRSSLNLGDE